MQSVVIYHSFVPVLLVPDHCIEISDQQYFIMFWHSVNDVLHVLYLFITTSYTGGSDVTYRELNPAVKIRSFTCGQEMNSFLTTPLMCPSSSLPECSRVSPVCILIRPKPLNVNCLLTPVSVYWNDLGTTLAQLYLRDDYIHISSQKSHHSRLGVTTVKIKITAQNIADACI